MASPLTLLIATSQHVGRVDAGAAVPAAKVVTRHTDGFPDAVLQALKLDGARPRQVFVLLDEVFTQMLALNVSQTAGLSPDEVERALAFEAEPLSGLGPFESALGFQMLDVRNGQRQFAIAQCPASLRDEIQRTLHAQGVKMLGIGHPRGILERALPSDDAGLQSWLNEAVKSLTPEGPKGPVIRAIELPTPAISFVLAGVAVLLLVGGLCFGHWRWMAGERAALAEEAKRQEQPEQALAEVRKKIDASKKELQTLRAAQKKALESRALLETELGRHRNALGALVDALARSRPEDAAIDVIESNGATVTVRGVSLDSRQADEWVTQLSAAVKTAGWVVQPQQKVALRRFDNGGPFAFTLQAMRAETAKPALPPAASTVSEAQP